MLRAAVLAATTAATLTTLACRPAPVGQPAPVRPTSQGAPVLADFIPGDAAVAMLIERGLFDHPFAATVNGDARRKLGAKLVAAANAPGDTPGDRFWREIARSLGELDDASLARAGWLSGRSTGALYTIGLVPVMRLHVDGIKAEGVIRVAARTAGITLTEKRHQGRPYLAYDDGDGVHIVIASAPDQLVVAIAHDVASVLDHVTTFTAPAGRSLSTTWDVGDADRFLLLDPARIARLIVDQKELARLAGNDEMPEAGCLAAVGRAIGEVPRTTWTVSSTPRSFSSDMTFDLSPETAALMRGGNVPGWAVDGDVPGFRVGLGVAPYPLMLRTEGLFEAIGAAQRACGEDDTSAGSPFGMLAAMQPLQLIQGVTLEMVTLDEREVTMSLAVAVRDVPAVWTMIASAMPSLGTTVPAIGEVRDLGSMGMPAHLAVGRDLLVGSMGKHSARRIRAIVDARPGPRMPVAMRFDLAFFRAFQSGKLVFMGEPMEEEDDEEGTLAADSFIDSHVEGNRLVVRTVMGAFPPKAD